MIRVLYDGLIEATFDAENGWQCEDEFLAGVLRRSFIEDDVSPDMVYWESKTDPRVKGLDAFALDSVAFLGKLEVIENVPAELPELEEGVVV